MSRGGGFGSLDSDAFVQEAVVTKSDGKFDVIPMARDTPLAVASGFWTPGSDYYSDLDRMYALGYLESYFLHDRIYDFWTNYKHNDVDKAPEGVREWFEDQRAYVKIMTEISEDPFWKRMAYVQAQTQGFIDGYQRYHSKGKEIDPLDMYILQSWGDLGDVAAAFNDAKKLEEGRVLSESTPASTAPFVAGPGTLDEGSCTGLIRLMPDGEIAVAHNTWRLYEGFIRVFKRVTYPNKLTVTMSSTPGLIHSKDDFYVQENGNLIAIETTNAMHDKEISATIATDPEARHVAPSRGSASLPLCCSLPAWMVVDVAKHHAGEREGVAMIAEQSVSYAHLGDISSVLYNRGYWKSYNIPYFPDVFEQMGYDDSDPQSSYHKASRSLISDRDAPELSNVADVMLFSRYNEYITDPLSYGCPRLTIASRYDLSDEMMCGAGAGPRAFGAIDAKVVSSGDMKTVHAVSGPTNDPENGIPVFEWSTSGVDDQIMHVGMPDRFDFPWVRFNAHSWDTEALTDAGQEYYDDARIVAVQVEKSGKTLLI
ncbi:hypothetical protein FOZ60_014628 [Perkinsus olseni]|uniref:Phospholipase B-like n=1 Tax=Perkinsus olseni TaxID=32597 RepID=A0A7J6PL62_PEROL|nr:hypothetical protein FOZ60_014628 [Perkinsus olseni]